MCGIAGYLTTSRVAQGDILRMTDSLAHRGPDDQGSWADPEAGIVLGHRRLSIVDLSAAGHEPMHSASGRFAVTFNGEIYNHGEIRSELERQDLVPDGGWRGHSDLETFLRAIECWGLDQALAKAVGMFAFALWDRKRRVLTLVRDRFGEKPLYYGWVGKDFLFASELKAIRTHPRFDGEIDREALRLFAARAYVPAPLSIYRGIFKLEPGCLMEVTSAACASPPAEAPRADSAGQGLSVRRYWSYRDVVEDGLANPLRDECEAIEQVETALESAIAGQSVADVPIGAFLSGGVDSSTVTAFYQRHSSTPVRTFSIGFGEAGYNEADHAKAVAQHLGTVHYEHQVTDREAGAVIPLLPQMYDEPFADASQIPTYLVSKFARERVTVAITGDGGDELFGGYNRHFLAPAMWRRIRRVPRPLRSAGGSALGLVPPAWWGKAATWLRGEINPQFGHKVHKGVRVAAGARGFDHMLDCLLDDWAFDPDVVRGERRTLPPGPALGDAPDAVRAMYGDAIRYLPDDVLCKVDRASMAVSLETRVPFLDHRVAAVAARVPLEMKIGGGTGKNVLRSLLYRHVPKRLIDRPKAGFSVPVGDWLRGTLRDWAEDLLHPRMIERQGFFDPALIGRRWNDHLARKSDSGQAIWSILMFQAWSAGLDALN